MRRLQMALGLLAVPALFLTACGGAGDAEAVPAQGLASGVEGVSQYLDETREGIVFYKDGYYIHFRMPKEFEIGESGLTDEDKVELWNSMALVAGTYTISGDTCTNRVLFSKNPASVGDVFQWVGEMRGDTILWAVLDGQGGYQEQGRSLRVY